MKTLVRHLPKIELHCHLEGAMRLTTIAEIGRLHSIDMPSYDPEKLRPFVEAGKNTKSLADWAPIFNILRRCFVNREVIAQITYEVIEDYALLNTRYLEIRFSPGFISILNGISMDEAVQGVIDGMNEAAKDFKVKTRAIILITRDLGPEMGINIAKCACRFAGLGVVGFDLAGNEKGNPPEHYVRAFDIAREAGLKITVHAGEECGPESIENAIDVLRAKRIGHGLSLGKDVNLIEKVRANNIVLEMCPTSNLKTRNVASLKEHPLHQYYKSGIKVTINADDPGVCATNLQHEYELAITDLGFNTSELCNTIIYAAEAAFLPCSEKAELVEEVRLAINKLGLK